MPRVRTAFMLALLLAGAGCLWPVNVRAHGDLHQRIQYLSGQIALHPDAADLFLQRGELHRQHGEFDLAIADLNAAEKQKADRRTVLLAQTRVFSDAGQTTNTLRAADELLALEPGCAEALTLRARCRLKLNQPMAAAADLDAAIASTARPEPDLYLERARVLTALGHFDAALKGLDDGMVRLGEVDSLQLAAIGYERQRGGFTAALERLDKLALKQPVKEPWQVLRGEILTQAGRHWEAKAEFQQAIAAIAGYPEPRRELELTRQLQARARAGLARAEFKINQARHQASAR